MNQITKNSIIALIFFLTICNNGAIASNLTNKSGKDEGEKLKKIMILFLGKNYENKKILEDELTFYINDRGFDALPSHRFITEIPVENPDTIITVLENNSFDGILVIELVDVAVKNKRVNAKMKYGYNPTTPQFNWYFNIYRQYSVGYNRIDKTFELEATLFRTSDKSQVYTVTSKAYEKGSLDLAIESYAKTTAKQLKSSKTLLKTK